MGTKHQKIAISLPGFDDSEKAAIAAEIIEHIIKRTKAGKDKTGKAFKGYSQEYAKSLDFKNAGKSKGDVNLTLSGDMLDSIEVLALKGSKVEIGFDPDSDENARADGNIRGTYGQDKPNPKKARDFLGIEPKALEAILAKYENDPNRADKILSTKKASARLAGEVLEGLEDSDE